MDEIKFSEENEKTLKKILEDLSAVFPAVRLADIAAFIRCSLDKGATFEALKLIHGQLGFIKQVLNKSEEPEHDGFLSHVQKYHSDFCSALQLEMSVLNVKL